MLGWLRICCNTPTPLQRGVAWARRLSSNAMNFALSEQSFCLSRVKELFLNLSGIGSQTLPATALNCPHHSRAAAVYSMGSRAIFSTREASINGRPSGEPLSLSEISSRSRVQACRPSDQPPKIPAVGFWAASSLSFAACPR